MARSEQRGSRHQVKRPKPAAGKPAGPVQDPEEAPMMADEARRHWPTKEQVRQLVDRD